MENELQNQTTKFNWTVREYIGAEIYPLAEDGSVIEKCITDYNGIHEGMKVQAWNSIFTIKFDGTFYLEVQSLIGTLNFGEDDRKCWVCGGLINKRAMEKLMG